MDLQMFYQELGQWVMSVNEKSSKLSPDAYWNYILISGAELSEKYENRPLVKKVIIAHWEFLEDMARG